MVKPAADFIRKVYHNEKTHLASGRKANGHGIMNIVKTFALFFIISGLFLFFQNCSVQQNGGILGGKESPAVVADKITTNAPFAYDLVADTISYNSCVGENLNNSGIHGLKIGVNEGFVDSAGTIQGGLKLRTEFLQYVGLNVPARYPSTVITPAQIQTLLQDSKANKDTYVQFAVRRKSDLAVMPDLINPTSLQLTLPRDGVLNFAPLSRDPVLSRLTKGVVFGEKGLIISEGERIYNLQDDSAPAPIQASLGYSSIFDETYAKLNTPLDLENFAMGERYSEVVRNRFNLASDDKYLLAVTFGSGSSATGSDYGLNTPRRPDDTVKSRAYGRSYALQFNMFRSPSAAGWKNNALKAVTEVDLTGAGANVRPWTCSNYVIMKQNQWNNAKLEKPSCTPLLASDFNNATMANAVKKLRRHYSESEWNIGLFYDAYQAYDPNTRGTQPICLVPKSNECYLPTENVIFPGADVGVNYNPLTECYVYNQFGVSYSQPILNVKAAGRCAQFASICTRER